MWWTQRCTVVLLTQVDNSCCACCCISCMTDGKSGHDLQLALLAKALRSC